MPVALTPHSGPLTPHFLFLFVTAALDVVEESVLLLIIYMLVITKEIEHLFKILVAIILTIWIFGKGFFFYSEELMGEESKS